MDLDRVRAQLRELRPADVEEARYVSRMLELSESPSACSRVSFEPGHFTASAFVLSPDQRELILIHHKKLGIWVQPGGHVDAEDADLEAAARREVAEEVGLVELRPFGASGALFDVDIHEIPARKADAAHEHFDVRFAFVSSTRDFVRSEEVADTRWVPLADVARVTSDRSVLRAVEKLRDLLGAPA